VRTFAGALFVGCLLQVCAAARVSETDQTRGEHAKESFEEDGLVSALSAADIAAPGLVAHVLQGAKLVPAELGQLDSVERAELVGAMQAVDVTLGDRFRLRRMSAAEMLPGVGSSECLEILITAAAFTKGTRALQSAAGGGGGGGVSGDSIALMVTALLGVGSFIVQAVTEKRSARASEILQRELDRELASREVARNTAGVQLERVRLQMAECARPLQYSTAILWLSMLRLGLEMSLAWGIPVFGFSSSLFAELVISPPAEKHTTLIVAGKLMRRPEIPISSTALDVAGLARLEEEPAWRERWVETWVNMEPYLRTIEDIVTTKAHLSEPIKLAVLDNFASTSGTLGSSWDEAFLSPGFVYQWVAIWVRQWCACSVLTAHFGGRFPTCF
jgi:hypothetical protein